MSRPALNAVDLLAWNDATSRAWSALTEEHPELLQAPCDIHNSATVGKLLQHIVAVELRYAERLSGAPVSDYANIPFASSAEIFDTHTRAISIFRRLADDPAVDWNLEMEFDTLTAGRLRATRNAVFQHALLHGIRHYAQLATLARQLGYSPGPMDFLLFAAQPITQPAAESDLPQEIPISVTIGS